MTSNNWEDWALGLPLVAAAFTAANAAVLAWRIRVENQALAWATRGLCAPETLSAGTLAKG